LVFIVNSSTLINLHRGGLLKEFLQLPFKLFALDVIIAELREPPGSELIKYGLISRKLTPDQITQVGHFAGKHRRLSINDVFALVLAKTLNATLLTDDGPLREVARE
jgi:hypothetical protein